MFRSAGLLVSCTEVYIIARGIPVAFQKVSFCALRRFIRVHFVVCSACNDLRCYLHHSRTIAVLFYLPNDWAFTCGSARPLPSVATMDYSSPANRVSTGLAISPAFPDSEAIEYPKSHPACSASTGALTSVPHHPDLLRPEAVGLLEGQVVSFQEYTTLSELNSAVKVSITAKYITSKYHGCYAGCGRLPLTGLAPLRLQLPLQSLLGATHRDLIESLLLFTPSSLWLHLCFANFVHGCRGTTRYTHCSSTNTTDITDPHRKCLSPTSSTSPMSTSRTSVS